MTDENAHPHFDASGKLALVHNGVIENYQALKDELIRSGDTNFRSETDTEVLAHLIGEILRRLVRQHGGRLPKKRRAWLRPFARRFEQVIGTYGIASGPCGYPGFHDRRAARKPARARGWQRRKFSGQ